MNLNLTDFLERRSKAFLVFFGVLLFAVVFLFDRTTSWEIEYSIVYLLPVSYFSWFFSTRMASVIALVSAASWLLLDSLKSPRYSMTSIPYWNTALNLALYLIFIFIVSEVKTNYLRERESSRLDFLTGTINQRGFYETLRRERQRASRLNLPTTLAYIDLDNFKQINDRFNHVTGDHVLASVGETLRRSVRNVDFTARLGGDEFCILLPHTDPAGAKVILQKVREALVAAMDSSRWLVTFSIGVVTFLRTDRTPDEMIRRVDEEMYSAKIHGKNHIQYAVEP